MRTIKKAVKLIDNYVLSRLQNRPSTALFWYLPEPAILKSPQDLMHYKQSSITSPLYLMDYRKKLRYTLENKNGIIVLPYENPVGNQINPEAAFQYALGLHDEYYLSHNKALLDKFFHYAAHFAHAQTADGLWHYHFDWFAAKAPWASALAQARGASVMLRAWLHSKDTLYYEAAKNAFVKFTVPTTEGGFYHIFTPENCGYYEEYPQIPTGVLNGFMSTLISIWELHYWLQEPGLATLWQNGILSLQKMLPYYTTGWWSLYDLDSQTPVANVNSPRYHFLEMQYLQTLSILSESASITAAYQRRTQQYANVYFRGKALGLKFIRKILYK